jgi:adenylate kinase
LEENEIYDLFESLLKQVIMHQPDDPLGFMIKSLQADVKVKVVLLGPPGMGRGDHAQKLADHYGVPCIKAGDAIKTYAAAHGGVELDELGSPVKEIDTCKAVVNALEALGDPASDPAGSSGWVLDGFPRTRAQALYLQQAKIVPDKVLLLNAPTGMVQQAMEAKVGGDADRAHRRVQQYLRHLLHTVEVYSSMIQQLDIDTLDRSQIVSQLISMVALRPASNAPLRPVRVCVLGPLGSGRTTLAKKLSAHYGAVHVDANAIVRAMKESGQISGDTLVEEVADDMLCNALRARLEQQDCAHKGWILDGFPLNRQQAAFLPAVHLSPSRVIHITVPEDLCFKRIATRKYDPVTGIAYYGNPAEVTVRQRLRADKQDKPEIVKRRFETHAKNIADVQTMFSRCFGPIRGDISALHVGEKATDFIDRPLV